MVSTASVAFEEFPCSVDSHPYCMNNTSVVARGDGAGTHDGFSEGNKFTISEVNNTK